MSRLWKQVQKVLLGRRVERIPHPLGPVFPWSMTNSHYIFSLPSDRAPPSYHSKSVKLALLPARALPSEREYLSPSRRREKTARQSRPPRRVPSLSSRPRQSARGCR